MWIKLSKQKPKVSQKCWVWDGDSVYMDIYQEYIDLRTKKYIEGFFRNENRPAVTHWKPFYVPEPPK
jgi:hypothetical protein